MKPIFALIKDQISKYDQEDKIVKTIYLEEDLFAKLENSAVEQVRNFDTKNGQILVQIVPNFKRTIIDYEHKGDLCKDLSVQWNINLLKLAMDS
ncbi:MAG TPA: hypothetical protein VL651_11890 [Bacteroidia bacterium]|jgi:hypothetical protein|nr:hypothetical protein [Bacteroidia bacterium]